MKIHYKIVAILALFAAVYACSTEKNSLVSRTFHGVNAHYNGYFNANELLRQSMTTYRESREENYYEILPINPMPDEDEVIGMYPAIDTAIAKCKKVIRDHSMPSNDRPARKKDEHNPWIDENWTTIGIAYYYRRDYTGALKSFKFIRKFYDNDPSLYIGELWMAKTYLAQGDLTKAKFNLDNLDRAVAEQKSKEEKKSKLSKYQKKKAKEEEKEAKFPSDIRFDLERTKAELAMENDEIDDVIKHLEESLKHAGYNDDRERVHFILGQLYAQKEDDVKAREHYSKVIKSKAKYEMRFNARLQRSFLGGGEKARKDLFKMLRDGKNAEFKDQIYYALANLELKEDNKPKGIEYLTLSAFYSTKNTRQKGMAYERLGDLSFDDKNYVSAQKYYDSCATVINDDYPNAEGIRNKADNLADLVVAVETADHEDSVQRIAALSDDAREKFLKDLIKQIKEDEKRRKEREAERLRELQSNENLFIQSGSGSKWYWNNAKTRSEGYEEFKRLWGQRENEDDWRRSEKTPVLNVTEGTEEELEEDSLVVEEQDTLTVEYLTSTLPLTDSTLALSNERLLQASYNAGVIYKDQLNEPNLAVERFEAVLNKKIENPNNLLSAYQLYKIYEGKDNNKASKYRDYIWNNYPNSDYANYLRDPDYFIKKKKLDALAEQKYVTVLNRYEQGMYYAVMTSADVVIKEEKDNVFRAKYLLLKAMCLGQVNDNKDDMIPYLDQTIAEYPGTPEANRAQEMLSIIKNGYSKNEAVDFGSKTPFNYTDRSELSVIIFLPEGTTSNDAKTKISDFHREFFSRDKLKVSSKVYGKEQSVVLVDSFEDEMSATNYIRVYKKTRKYLLDLQNAKILMITPENLKVLFQKHNLVEYESFYEEYY